MIKAQALKNKALRIAKQTPGYRAFEKMLKDEGGATALEWTLVLTAVVLPSYFIFDLLLRMMLIYYRMITGLNSMPFP